MPVESNYIQHRNGRFKRGNGESTRSRSNDGKKRLGAITYADDVALLATNEEIMKEMIKKIKKYIERRKLKLSVENLKIMVFRKAGGREKKRQWKWEEETMEEVKTYKYLGYIMKKITVTKNM